MKNIAQLLVVVGSLALASNAQTTYSHCVTERGTSKLASVPTTNSYTTETNTVTVVKTVQHTTTVTPTNTKTSTHTVVHTSTFTAPKTTDTQTVTVLTSTTDTIQASTTTFTDVAHTTTTTTSVNAALTSTVATSAGFLPANDTLPTAPAKRMVGGLAALAGRAAKKHKVAISNKVVTYPKRVVCQNIIAYTHTDTSTTTVKATATTTRRPVLHTTTATVTSTITVTSLKPPATTTSTITSTSTDHVTTTPSTTVTSTSTSVVTVEKPVATQYAACSPPNTIDMTSSGGISLVAPPNPAVIGYTQDTKPYDCCVACILNPLCAAASFYKGFAPGQQCQNYLLSTAGQCASEGQYNFGVKTNANLLGKDAMHVSNGNCGFYDQYAA